jgi:hypothetical protein
MGLRREQHLDGSPCASHRDICVDVAKDFLGEVGEEIAQDCLVLRYPGGVIRVHRRNFNIIVGLLLREVLRASASSQSAS